MDIITSFVKNNNKYTFTKILGDGSLKKQFYLIKEYETLLLVKIIIDPNDFDEYFDEEFTNLSQYDYYKYTLQLFDKLIGSVPKIMAYDDENGIILMEKVGTTRLKEYLQSNYDEKYVYATIDWLVSLQKISAPNNSIINLRHYGAHAMKNEISLYIQYGFPYINSHDHKLFMKELDHILESINNSTKTINHRDYQSRNMMLHNNKPYIIDTQDSCIGPYFADFASFIINLNTGTDKWKTYAQYFYDQISGLTKDSFEEFYQKVLWYGFIRVMKSSGSHLRRYKNTGRLVSLEQVETNKKIMEKINSQLVANPLFAIIQKYQIVPIILAAGKGSRMKSDIPKTLCEINGKPMLFYILDAVLKINPYKIIIVIGHKKEQIIKKLEDYHYKNIELVEQTELKGTGHAVMQAENSLKNFHGQIMVLMGDNPTISDSILEPLCLDYFSNNLDASLVSYLGKLDHRKSGRIIRDKGGQICEIREDPDENYPSNEFGSAVHMYHCQKLYDCIKGIGQDNAKNEYYLGDVVKIMYQKKYRIGSYRTDQILLNVNTKEDLQRAGSLFPTINNLVKI